MENVPLSSAILALTLSNKERDRLTADLMNRNDELTVQNIEKTNIANELISSNSDLKKAALYQKQYIKALEKIMHIVSHQIRQPVSQLMGLSSLLQLPKNSKDEVKTMVDFVKKSAISLDFFTRQLTNTIKQLINNNKRHF
jgi:signal transduction histidine kinase